MKKRVTAKKACKYLRLESKLKVPICTLEPVICTYWFCNVKGFRAKEVKCDLYCFRRCAIKNPNAVQVPNIIEIYEKTIENADARLDHYRNEMPGNRLIGGLLAHRELEVLRAFSQSPGAFTDVFQVQDLIPSDISFLEAKDIFINEDSSYFTHLLAIRNVMAMQLHRIKNGSLLVYATQKGLDELKQVRDDPESDEFLKMTAGGKEFFAEQAKDSKCYNIMRFEPIKNFDVLQWCRANGFQREILKFSNGDHTEKIIVHFDDVGKTGCIDARECYDLSYQPYMNSIYALRNIYSHSRKFLRIARDYKDLWERSENIVSWMPLWDKSVFAFFSKAQKEDFLVDRFDVDDHPEYPMNIGDRTFFGSLAMWTFIGKNWDDICSNRWTKGRIFEEKVTKELLDRDINIIDTNIPLTPDDEVDFLCEKKGRFYMIEAKDYGPNWDYNFLSSEKYSDRITELNSKVALSPRRLELINNRRDHYLIPHDTKLQGVIITSFIEPHIDVPVGFECLNIDRISRVFGKKIKQPRWKKNPVLQIPEDVAKERDA
jgi:hypothetical protein